MASGHNLRDNQKYKKILSGFVGAGILIAGTIFAINILFWITGGTWADRESVSGPILS